MQRQQLPPAQDAGTTWGVWPGPNFAQSMGAEAPGAGQMEAASTAHAGNQHPQSFSEDCLISKNKLGKKIE